MRKPVTVTAVLTAVLIWAGCRTSTEPIREFTVSLTANTLLADPGDTLTLTVDAAGSSLVGVVMDFGDGTVEQYATGGATSAHVNFRHAWSAGGTFPVRAEVTDAYSGEKTATLDVVISGPATNVVTR